MTDRKPIYLGRDAVSSDPSSLVEFKTTDAVGLVDGGTGVTSLSDLSALLNLSAFDGESSDHGELTGLGDNDHPQYTLSSTNSTLSSLVTTLNDIKNNGQLMVRKSSAQASTASWVDFSAFNTVDVSGGDVDFSTTSGIATIQTTGLYRIGYNFVGENTVNGRAGLEGKLLVDTGSGYADIPQTISGGYARLDTAEHYATVACEAYLRECTSGDLIKSQIQHTTNVLNVEGYISIERRN